MEVKSNNMVNEPSAPYGTSPIYTIPQGGLFNMLSTISIDDIPLAVKYLADKLVRAQAAGDVKQTIHTWDNYQLSDEVRAMAPLERKNVYGNYDEELASILEEKYR